MQTYHPSLHGKTKKSVITAKPEASLVARPLPVQQPAEIPHATQEEQANAAPASFLEQALCYQIDRWQRSVLFLDMLRERSNNMLAHKEAGMPPPLDFDYETILDARLFEHPVNYALLRITRCRQDRAEDCVDEKKPPVIIVDPRAGHGPGIGGFKRDSEVGMALHEGHATYFVIFFPLPSPNQTLADVLHALRRFVEEVSRRHHGAAPVLYGNCQAGWAVTLLAADCEGLAGATVLNGSPLSYWAGASDVNPMRLAGGLLGGVWLTHLLTDLSNGRLDGAWLVQNFENLNPANTLWDKNYNVFAHVDTERERFLEFERWWTGYHFLSREEILSIIDNQYAYPEKSFEKVQAVSEWNEHVYKNTISPWITAFANPLSAEMLKWLHPMRIGNAMFSEKLTPWMLPVKMFAPFVANARLPADETNRFAAMETETSTAISRTLDSYRKIRDGVSEQIFSMLYGRE